MIYCFIAPLFSLRLDLGTVGRPSGRPTDRQILLLRQQLRILQRQPPATPRISRWEKLALAVLARKLTQMGSAAKGGLDQVLLLFRPATVLQWHKELVHRKWTFKQQPFMPRHQSDPAVVALLLRLARENPNWGDSRLPGELLKLDHKLGRSTVRDILKRNHRPPAPQRDKAGGNWRTFLGHYADQIIACDFLTVETALRRTLPWLFCIELGSRRVHFAGCSEHPTGEWVTQQARQLTWTRQDEHKSIKFLIHDRDAQFTASFNTVFAAAGSERIRTPYRAPPAKACAERWVRSARSEGRERILILNEAHLRHGLKPDIEHYNRARPHQGIQQRGPIPIDKIRRDGEVKRRDMLGGIIHEDSRDAA